MLKNDDNLYFGLNKEHMFQNYTKESCTSTNLSRLKFVFFFGVSKLSKQKKDTLVGVTIQNIFKCLYSFNGKGFRIVSNYRGTFTVIPPACLARLPNVKSSFGVRISNECLEVLIGSGRGIFVVPELP